MDRYRSPNQKESMLNDKTESEKNYDLKKLKEMSGILITFQNEKTCLRRCVLNIGKLSGGITVSGYVFKQYGYIASDKEANKNRIPFDKLYHLENIFCDKQIYSLITADELKQLGKGMNCLNEIIINILKSEDFEDNLILLSKATPNFNVSISDIISLSDKYFEKLTSKLISREVNILETIDFNIKDDRYFISRLLCKIGEFFNELIKDVKIVESGKEMKTIVLKAFKNLIGIRNKLIHNFTVISNGMNNFNDYISEAIREILEHLKVICSQLSEDSIQFSINYQYKNAAKFEEITGKLLKCFSNKLFTAEEHKMSLNKLILKAYEIFRKHETEIINEEVNKKKNKINNELKIINKQYKSHLNELGSLNDPEYPLVLSLETKDLIIKKGEMLQKFSIGVGVTENLSTSDGRESQHSSTVQEKMLTKKPNTDFNDVINKTDYNNLLSNEIEYSISILGHTGVRKLFYIYHTLINDHIIKLGSHPFSSHFPSLDENKNFHEAKHENRNEDKNNERGGLKDIAVSKETKDSVATGLGESNGWSQRFLGKCEQLDKEFKEKYPAFYDEWNRNKQNTCHQDFQQRIDDLFQEMFKSLKEEVDDYQVVKEYFINEYKLLLYDYVDTELNEYPELKKYDYIMQQSVLHIQQLIRDLEKLLVSFGIIEDLSIEHEDHDRIVSCFNKYASFRYIRNETRLCNGYRSCGVGHKILSFDPPVFHSDMIGDTVNFSEYLQCFHRIMKSKGLITVMELFNMGKDLFKIELIMESRKYLDRALKRYKSHPDEAERHYWDEEYIKIFGEPRLLYEIYKIVLAHYELSEQYVDMYQIAKEIIGKMNIEELQKCNIDEIKCHASLYYRVIGQYYMMHENNYSLALESIAKAEHIYRNNSNKRYMAEVYFKIGEYGKAKELYKSIIESGEEPFESIIATSLIMLCNSRDETVKNPFENAGNYIGQMETLFETGRHSLKTATLDKHYGMELGIMNMKLSALIADITNQGMSSNRLKELNQIDKKFQYLKPRLDDETSRKPFVAFCNLLLCTGFSQVYTLGDLIWRINMDYLKAAQDYFKAALKMHNVLLLHSGDGALEHYGETGKCLIHAYINYIDIQLAKFDIGFLIDLLYEIEKTDPDFAAKLFDELYNFIKEIIDSTGTENGFISNIDCDILLAYWMKNNVILKCDLQPIKCWLSLYYKLSNVSFSSDLQHRLHKQETGVREFLTNLTKVLVEILFPRDESIEPMIQCISFCLKKWNIEISYRDKKFRWKHGIHFSGEIREIITRELNFIGELFVIYIFVMGYFKT